MTCIARYFAMPVEIVRVDREHHFHHLARSLLVLLVVLFKRALHVAEIALYSERRGDELHRRKYLLRRHSLEHLDILELLLRLLRSRCSRTRLRLHPAGHKSTCRQNRHTPQTHSPRYVHHLFASLGNVESLAERSNERSVDQSHSAQLRVPSGTPENSPAFPARGTDIGAEPHPVGMPETLLCRRDHAQQRPRTHFASCVPCRSKNFHLSIPAGTATSKNPTIISSEVWSPQVTVLVGSGLCGLFFELSYQAIARSLVPALSGRGSASL